MLLQFFCSLFFENCHKYEKTLTPLAMLIGCFQWTMNQASNDKLFAVYTIAIKPEKKVLKLYNLEKKKVITLEYKALFMGKRRKKIHLNFFEEGEGGKVDVRPSNAFGA